MVIGVLDECECEMPVRYTSRNVKKDSGCADLEIKENIWVVGMIWKQPAFTSLRSHLGEIT